MFPKEKKANIKLEQISGCMRNFPVVANFRIFIVSSAILFILSVPNRPTSIF